MSLTAWSYMNLTHNLLKAGRDAWVLQPGANADAHKRAHLFGREPLEQRVEGRSEAEVLQPEGNAAAHVHNHMVGRETLEQSVEVRHNNWVLHPDGAAVAQELDQDVEVAGLLEDACERVAVVCPPPPLGKRSRLSVFWKPYPTTSFCW